MFPVSLTMISTRLVERSNRRVSRLLLVEFFARRSKLFARLIVFLACVEPQPVTNRGVMLRSNADSTEKNQQQTAQNRGSNIAGCCVFGSKSRRSENRSAFI